MKPDRWQDIERIYNAALECEPDARGIFLRQECGGDDGLRREVESLLGYQGEATGLLEAPLGKVMAEKIAEGETELIGHQIVNYRIVSRLGAGGMGEVYLAEDTRLNRKVAIKLLPASLTEDERARKRFVREAKTAAALDHPNICAIYEVGEEAGRSFISMQYVEGETLAERMRRRPLEVPEALSLAAQTADALTEAHARGVVHRDIKPQNVMLTPRGTVKVLDFGLARIVRRAQGVESEAATEILLSTPGLIVGTLPYMSPEQVRGEPVDARTDIFSFGVTLYEMLTGRQPFAAESGAATISSILSKEPPPLGRFAPQAPRRLEEIVEKALAKDRDERYQTSKDLFIDLKRLKQSLEVQAGIERGSAPEAVGAPTTPATKLPTRDQEAGRRRLTSSRRAGLLSMAVLALVVAGALVYAWRLKLTGALGQGAISSVAVLPFANTSSDPDTEYLSDGITDNIIERLSQLPGLKVMSHSAVFHYKGRQADAQAVGRELDVAAVLSGRLARRGDALTINVELVDARDNTHVWGEQYDRKLSDLLAVQREIPLDVSDKLRLRLSGESKERLTRAHTGDAEAYQLYLKGRYSWEKWTQDGARQAVKYFEEAIRKDPKYALAYSGLADAYIFGVGPGVPQKEAHRRAREAATNALSLDPQLGEAHAALGEVLLYDDWDFSGAERELQRAIELSPGYAEGHHQYSHLLLLLGRIDESFAESKKLLELDPVSETPIGHLGYHYLYARQYAEAIQQLQKALQLYPDAAEHMDLGDAYYQNGMFSEAVEEYLKGLAQQRGFAPDKVAGLSEAFAKSGIRGFNQKLIEQLKAGPQTEEDHFFIAELYARLGEKDQAFEWLEKSYAEHADGLAQLKEHMGFASLRSDPRYADLVGRVGLPQ